MSDEKNARVFSIGDFRTRRRKKEPMEPRTNLRVEVAREPGAPIVLTIEEDIEVFFTVDEAKAFARMMTDAVVVSEALIG